MIYQGRIKGIREYGEGDINITVEAKVDEKHTLTIGPVQWTRQEPPQMNQMVSVEYECRLVD